MVEADLILTAELELILTEEHVATRSVRNRLVVHEGFVRLNNLRQFSMRSPVKLGVVGESVWMPDDGELPIRFFYLFPRRIGGKLQMLEPLRLLGCHRMVSDSGAVRLIRGTSDLGSAQK